MEIINGQLHSESIARVSASKVGADGEVVTMGAAWEYWNDNGIDGGLSFSSEGSAGLGEVFFTDCTGNSFAWNEASAWAQGSAH